jgi:nucleoside-diphosphate-sugar epimerase
MRVAVTGSSGLVGRHVVEALLGEGHSIVGVDSVLLSQSPIEQLIVDLRDFGSVVEALSGCDAVVHAGAIPRPTGHVGSQVFANNTLGTYNVVEACLVHEISQLVYASSYSVVGLPFNESPVAIHYLPLDEAHPNAPQDAYALSKYIGEEIIEAAVRRKRLQATSIRMPWVQTPESFGREVVPLREDPVAAERSLWSYVDARDAGRAFALAIGRSGEGHRRILVSAADTFMDCETKSLVASAFGGVELRGDLDSCAGVIDCTLAQRLIGYVAQHSWREYSL